MVAPGAVGAMGGTVSTIVVTDAIPMPAVGSVMVAVMVTEGASAMVVVRLALPEASSVPVPSVLPAAAKVTVPEVSGAPPTVTWAVIAPCQPGVPPSPSARQVASMLPTAQRLVPIAGTTNDTTGVTPTVT